MRVDLGGRRIIKEKWTIDHGTITGGNGTTNVTYTADASGQPVVLHVHVQDWGYCTADNSATIPIRSLSPPVIHTRAADLTPTVHPPHPIQPPLPLQDTTPLHSPT